MSSSVLELLEESSDELPRISDLEKETNEVLSSDGKDKNEIVEISDDEIIEISSEEQLPSFEKTQNNNRKAGFKIKFYNMVHVTWLKCVMHICGIKIESFKA